MENDLGVLFHEPNWVEKLRPLLDGDLYQDEINLKSVSTDHSHIWIKPKMVVMPRHSEDIKTLINFVNTNKKQIPDLSITPRSGGMCVTGGPLNESIILDVNRYMNRLLSVNSHRAVVQPGQFYRDFDVETKKYGSYLPPYPASRDLCCIGGMVGNNSGGPQAFSHGKVHEFVMGLKVVLSDGEEYEIGPLNEDELERKRGLNNFEGRFYRQISDLIFENYEILQNAKPKVTKNSSGYALWDVWDHERRIFDLTRLFTGSQGTLGIISESTFRLSEYKKYKKLMVVFLDDISRISELIEAIKKHNPEELEAYHQSIIKTILHHLPTFGKSLDINPYTFGFQFHSELFEILKTKPMIPELLILPKFSGNTQDEVDQAVARAEESLKSFGLPIYVTDSKEDLERYRKLRHDSFYFFQNPLGGKEEITLFDDVCVRVDQLSVFLPKAIRVVEKCSCDYFLLGHFGNGNVHFVPFMDPAQKKDQKLISNMIDEIYEITLKHGGTISGEHNDGLVRTAFIPKMYGQEVYELFKKTKQIFDPLNIFNPGKKVMNEKTQSLQYTFEHMMSPQRTKE